MKTELEQKMETPVFTMFTDVLQTYDTLITCVNKRMIYVNICMKYVYFDHTRV